MRRRKIAFLFILGIAACSLVACALFYYGFFGQHRILLKSSFAQLPNWTQEDPTQAFAAFKQSCTEILQRPSNQAQDWKRICIAVEKLKIVNMVSTRKFFETWFVPYKVTSNFDAQGLFTGYYLPVIQASLKPDQRYHVPIYGTPKDLVKIDLGLFKPEWRGQTLTGQVQGNKVVPYPTRAAINRNPIHKNAPVIAWADDSVDVFFAHIQGSTLVQLPNQKPFIISVSSTNGQAYTAIGKILIDRGEIKKEQMSMQAIRTWLEAHPQQANEILEKNDSFVFFRVVKTDTPIGSGRAPLTSGRSLAVDTRYIPFGAPVWVDTLVSVYPDEKKLVPLQRLVVAQDIGSAIRGVVRGDIYWGSGKEAAFVAGHMKNRGQYWVLLPKQPSYVSEPEDEDDTLGDILTF
jgi:membrane-bound lytic murein transglycosylase A